MLNADGQQLLLVQDCNTLSTSGTHDATSHLLLLEID